MIAATELMVGNYILSDGCPVKVEAVLDEYSTVRTKQGNLISCRHELAKPIIITGELLRENCGFEINSVQKKEYVYKIPDSHIRLKFKIGERFLYDNIWLPAILHLHTLQNFYSVLYNFHLPVKF